MMRVLVTIAACAAGVLLPTGLQPILDGDAGRGAPALAVGLALCALAMIGDRRQQRRDARPMPTAGVRLSPRGRP